MWLKQRAINFKSGWLKLPLTIKVVSLGFILALAIMSIFPDFGIPYIACIPGVIKRG